MKQEFWVLILVSELASLILVRVSGEFWELWKVVRL